MSKHGRGHGNAGGYGRGHGGGHGSDHGGRGGYVPRAPYRGADRYDAPPRARYDDAPYDDAPDYRAAERQRSGAGYEDQRYDQGYDRRNSGGSGMVLAVAAGLVVWSLIAWLGYVAVDPVMRWLAGSAGLLVDGGKAIAAVAGVGKEVGAVADGINTSGFIGQSIALMQAILKPLIVVGWALGVLALLAAPLVLRRIGGLRRLRGLLRH